LSFGIAFLGSRFDLISRFDKGCDEGFEMEWREQEAV
jgi:hypothetical protein